MALVVQKFGGSSVADAAKIKRVAGIIADKYCEGNDVVVVLSAQGDTTDDLIEKAREINENPSRREMDMLLTTGEQISIALCAMALEKMGLPVITLTGWQIGMYTNSDYGNARIKRIRGSRLQKELDKHKIVIVAGFQGINKYDDVTTLGRGGSDTTAVAIAAALHADLCQIYTDVDGVYTADPRKVSRARKLPEITYDEMLELASMGAQVLHNRSVQMAKRYNVELEVLSSYERKPGTIVREVVKTVEHTKIGGIAKDTDVARIAVVGLNDQPGVAFKLFRIVAKENVNVDIILQSLGRNGTQDISFTVKRGEVEKTFAAIEKNRDVLRYDHIDVDTNVAKVSLVGMGIMSNAGTAARMFEVMYNAKVNINMINTSEIKVSVLIAEKDADRTVQALHDEFFDVED